MKLAFVDLGGWDYDADTPYESPLGGSQSPSISPPSWRSRAWRSRT